MPPKATKLLSPNTRNRRLMSVVSPDIPRFSPERTERSYMGTISSREISLGEDSLMEKNLKVV